MANPLQRFRNETTQAAQEWDPFAVMREAFNTPYWNFPLTTQKLDRFMPDFDVKEGKEGYYIKADLPGVKESDVEVSYQGNQLRISGKREADREEKGETWYASERSFGTFTRVITLPDAANGDQTRAEMKDGVLNIMIPRRAETQARKIDVKPGK